MRVGVSQPEHDVTVGDPVAGEQPATLHRTHGEAGEVVIALGVEARHLRRLAADQRTARLPATFGNAGDDGAAVLHRQPRRGVIVEEEQGLRALDDEVVDAHGNQVDADRLVPVTSDRQLQLGADTVGGGDEQRIDEAGRTQIEQRAEASQFVNDAIAPGRPRQRPDGVHQPLTRVDIDARVLVREPADGFPRATCYVAVGSDGASWKHNG